MKRKSTRTKTSTAEEVEQLSQPPPEKKAKRPSKGKETTERRNIFSSSEDEVSY